MKKIALYILTIAGLLVAGCDNKKDDDLLVLGTSLDYPPFEFGNNGEPMGYDIDLARAIAKKMGKQLRILDLDFSTLIPALNTGKIDFIMAGLSPNADRRRNVDFSAPYYEPEMMAFIFQKGKKVDSLAALSGKTVGTQLGSYTEAYLKEHEDEAPGMNIHTLAKNPTLVQELKVGRIDAVMIAEAQAKKYAEKNSDLDYYVIPVEEEGVSAAFKKGSDLIEAFNAALEELKADGTVKQLSAKWLED